MCVRSLWMLSVLIFACTDDDAVETACVYHSDCPVLCIEGTCVDTEAEAGAAGDGNGGQSGSGGAAGTSTPDATAGTVDVGNGAAGTVGAPDSGIDSGLSEDAGTAGESGSGGQSGMSGQGGESGSGNESGVSGVEALDCPLIGDRCPAVCDWVTDCLVNDGDFGMCTSDAREGMRALCLESCANTEQIANLVCGHSSCDETVLLFRDSEARFAEVCAQNGGEGGQAGEACTPVLPGDCLGDVGAACELDENCLFGNLGGGDCIDANWADGYCSTACISSDDCPEGSVCGGRLCLAACEDSTDCRQGYDCRIHMGTLEPVCAPSLTELSRPGSPCTLNTTCLGTADSAFCIPEDRGFEGGLCTGECFLDTDCPQGSVCADLDNEQSVCLPPCVLNLECRDQYTCWDGAFTDGRDFCWPVASGDGALLAPCTVWSDCEGGEQGYCDFEGKCRRVCDANTSCPTASHCGFVNPDTLQGTCLPDYEPDELCPEGLVRFDDDPSGEPYCWRGATGTAEIGTECDAVSECAGGADGLCLFEGDGVCSMRCGFGLPECPVGSHCGFVNENETGLCLRDCDTERGIGCGLSQACDEFDEIPGQECLPLLDQGGGVGDSCVESADCGLGPFGRCISPDTYPGGFCTQGCDDDVFCPEGSHCVPNSDDSDSGICYPDCEEASECRAGYTCRNIDRDALAVLECAPSGVGRGRTGDRCGTAADCADVNASCIDGDAWIQGYCSIRDCTVDRDCPADAHCSYVNETTGLGVCLRSCENETECPRSDYGCIDTDQNGRFACAPIAAGDGAPGDPCQRLADCSGGVAGYCLTDGWTRGTCSRSCSTQSPCPGGSTCYIGDSAAGTGACLMQCNETADCRTGYKCTDYEGNGRGECWPSAEGQSPVGGPCEFTSDCAGGEGGFCGNRDANPNGYCGLDCDVDTPCPSGAVCSFVDTQTGQGSCYDICEDSTDCRARYKCLDGDGNGVKECYPSAEGTGSIGDPCQYAAQCGGGELGWCQTRGYPDGMCLAECNADNQCPNGSVCSDSGFSDAIGVCFPSCRINANCREGYRCIDPDGDGRLQCRLL